MSITVGTFNLNNLFSRWNFQGEIEAIQDGDTNMGVGVSYVFGDADTYRIRTFMGRLVRAKDQVGRQRIIERIQAIDVDVLAVQEVEDLDTLRRFAIEDLGGLYPYRILIEGNDPRLIDVAVLSKLPIRSSTSYRHAVHSSDANRPVFGRDLLEVEVYSPTRSRLLFTLYNNHLKSHYVPFGQDPVAGAVAANARRRRQAEVIAEIVNRRMRANSRFMILGDMNDPPDSADMAPLVNDAGLNLVDGLANVQEIRPPGASSQLPAQVRWTHRFKPSGQPAEYELYDQVWLSPSLANLQQGAWIHRRRNLTGYGSDHDPAWVELDL